MQGHRVCQLQDAGNPTAEVPEASRVRNGQQYLDFLPTVLNAAKINHLFIFGDQLKSGHKSVHHLCQAVRQPSLALQQGVQGASWASMASSASALAARQVDNPLWYWVVGPTARTMDPVWGPRCPQLPLIPHGIPSR